MIISSMLMRWIMNVACLMQTYVNFLLFFSTRSIYSKLNILSS